MNKISYRRHRFPAAIIQRAVWLCFRFPLSYRDVEDLLAERGVDVSYETIRRWSLKFGQAYQPVEKGVIDRVSRHGEAYRGEGGFAILRDDEDDLNDQDGSSGRNKHEQGANSARHGLLRGAGADELAHQQR